MGSLPVDMVWSKKLYWMYIYESFSIILSTSCSAGFLTLFFLQLEYDVLEYVVIERLAQSGREKLKDDGLNLSDWLQSLASFWGHLYVCSQSYSFDLLV